MIIIIFVFAIFILLAMGCKPKCKMDYGDLLRKRAEHARKEFAARKRIEEKVRKKEGNEMPSRKGKAMVDCEYDLIPPDYGDLIPITEFLERCRCKLFIDYDGHGYPFKDGKYKRTLIKPSSIDQIPSDATHILWFNR